MKKIILICSSLLASFIFTTGFAAVSTGQACTPGTSTFCACYTQDLQSNPFGYTAKQVVHELLTHAAWKNPTTHVNYPAGLQAGCAFGCFWASDNTAQCVTDCVTDTNYFIHNCSFTAANLP